MPINDSQKLDKELSLCLDQALNYDGDGETHVNVLAEAGEEYARTLIVTYLRRSLPELPEVRLELTLVLYNLILTTGRRATHC